MKRNIYVIKKNEVNKFISVGNRKYIHIDKFICGITYLKNLLALNSNPNTKIRLPEKIL